MSIKVDIKPNRHIPVHLKEDEEIKVKECNISWRIIKQELDKKEDKVQYIEILEPNGVFDTKTLNLLISNNLNKIIYQNKYYNLSYKDNSVRRYLLSGIDPNIIYTVTVDMHTGQWHYNMILNQELQEHIADNNRHIREGEREFWNNKLNFEARGEVLEFNRE